MKKKLKTYGIRGYMEYLALICAGTSRIKVLFTEGSVSSLGIKPAKHTTDNYIVQDTIERSKQYEEGLIELLSETELDEELEIMTSPANDEKPEGPPEWEEEAEGAQAPEEGEEGTSSRGLEALEAADAEEGAEAAPTEEGSEAAEAAVLSAEGEEAGVEIATSAGAGLIQVEFASNDEAKDYLEQEFGLVRSKLRNREEIRQAGLAHGVEIIFV